MTRVAADAFELDLSVLGYWRHNRIVWAGTAHTPAPLGAFESPALRWPI